MFKIFRVDDIKDEEKMVEWFEGSAIEALEALEGCKGVYYIALSELDDFIWL